MRYLGAYPGHYGTYVLESWLGIFKVRRNQHNWAAWGMRLLSFWPDPLLDHCFHKVWDRSLQSSCHTFLATAENSNTTQKRLYLGSGIDACARQCGPASAKSISELALRISWFPNFQFQISDFCISSFIVTRLHTYAPDALIPSSSNLSDSVIFRFVVQ